MPDDDQQQQQTPPINLADPAALTAAYQQYLQYLQQVGNQRPAQAPVISQAQLDANRPTSLLGQLGEALGGGAPSDVPMTSDQRERAGMRGLFNFSRGLLGTGTFDSIGQALDRGLTEAERGQYNQEAQVAYGQAAAQDWQRQQMSDRLAALKESIPLLQGIQRLNMPSLYGPGGGPGAQAGNTPGTVPGFTARDPKVPTVGQQANNPGNVMADNALPLGATGWIPAANGRKVAAYPDITTGIAANAANLASYADQGINTVRQAVTRWVGDPKADLGTYITDVSKALGVGPDDKIDLTDPKVQSAFITAQQPHETGKSWFTPDDVTKGVQLAADWRSGKSKPPGAAAPGQVAQQPPAAPAQPATKPPAPAGGGETAALPTPPQPPPGAVPTVSTPEQAVATAKAAGTPIQIPGTQALWATPEGGSTSTPRLIMPGTAVASATPNAPVPVSVPAPPPGAVPPAPQPPAQQPPAQPAPQQPPAPQPPAQQPPAQQQTTQAAPAAQPPKIATTPEEYAALHPANGLDQPDQATVQHDAQAVAAAQQQLQDIRKGIVGGDASKAQNAVQAALNAQADHIADAKQKYWSTVVMPGYEAEQKQQLETQKATWRPMEPSDFAAHNITPEPGVTYLINPLGETKIQQTPVDPRLQKLAEVDAGTFNTDFQQPHIELMRLRPLMDQMDALRQQMIHDGSMNTGATGDTIRKLQGVLVSAGLGTEGMTQGLSNAQAYQALAQQLVLAMKQNTGLSRITNYDLQILQQQIPGMNQSAGGQQMISGLLRQLWDYQDKVYGAASKSLHDRSTGYTLSDLDKNVAAIPEAIPKLPTEALPQNGKGGWNTDQLTQWRQQHGLLKGQVFRMPNGDYQVVGN
jgi:hypothetical protein